VRRIGPGKRHDHDDEGGMHQTPSRLSRTGAPEQAGEVSADALVRRYAVFGRASLAWGSWCYMLRYDRKTY